MAHATRTREGEGGREGGQGGMKGGMKGGMQRVRVCESGAEGRRADLAAALTDRQLALARVGPVARRAGLETAWAVSLADR